jgi:hypothetical protein
VPLEVLVELVLLKVLTALSLLEVPTSLVSLEMFAAPPLLKCLQQQRCSRCLQRATFTLPARIPPLLPNSASLLRPSHCHQYGGSVGGVNGGYAMYDGYGRTGYGNIYGTGGGYGNGCGCFS